MQTASFRIRPRVAVAISYDDIHFYGATAKISHSVKQYVGITEGKIKKKIYNHKVSFSNRNYSTNTSLSSHICHLKDMNITWTSTRLQQVIKKIPFLPPWETRNYHSPITKYPTKQKVRNTIQMLTWGKTSTLTFWPIHIIYDLLHHIIIISNTKNKPTHLHE